MIVYFSIGHSIKISLCNKTYSILVCLVIAQLVERWTVEVTDIHRSLVRFRFARRNQTFLSARLVRYVFYMTHNNNHGQQHFCSDIFKSFSILIFIVLSSEKIESLPRCKRNHKFISVMAKQFAFFVSAVQTSASVVVSPQSLIIKSSSLDLMKLCCTRLEYLDHNNTFVKIRNIHSRLLN